MGGQTNPRLDAEEVLECIAEWRENAKCKDWTMNLNDCCCATDFILPPPDGEPELPPKAEEELIRLKFKFAIDFDSLTPSGGTIGHHASRYKIREITDEQAYDGDLIPKVYDEDNKWPDLDEEGNPHTEAGEVKSEEQQSWDAYYRSLDCGNWVHDDPDFDTWGDKIKDFGDVFLICRELWWERIEETKTRRP